MFLLLAFMKIRTQGIELIFRNILQEVSMLRDPLRISILKLRVKSMETTTLWSFQLI